MRYPAAFAETYIRPEVRLEIGPLASWVPSSRYAVLPMRSTSFHSSLPSPIVRYWPLLSERTFWENAAPLHREAHRDGLIPQRYSRVYYDVDELSLSSVRQNALAQTTPLREWWRSRNSSTRAPGRATKYEHMQMMLFGESPAFASILEGLTGLEGEIHLPAAKVFVSGANG